jgi:predicted O-methyltransferase YrrM
MPTAINDKRRMGPLVYCLEKLLKYAPLTVIETGTIRVLNSRENSTFHISNTLNDKGILYSIDNNPQHIVVSKQYCNGRDNIIWIESDSVAYLKSRAQESADLLFLDSINNREHIFNEFIEALRIVKQRGFIVIDDAGVGEEQRHFHSTAAGAEKGRKVAEFLYGRRLPYTLHGEMLIFRRADYA